MARFALILVWALVGSALTAVTLITNAEGTFHPRALTLPAVPGGLAVFATLAGLVVSPLMYWCLRDKKLLLCIPILIVSAVSITMLLCWIEPLAGLYGSIAYWIAALVTLRFLGPPRTLSSTQR